MIHKKIRRALSLEIRRTEREQRSSSKRHQLRPVRSSYRTRDGSIPLQTSGFNSIVKMAALKLNSTHPFAPVRAEAPQEEEEAENLVVEPL